MPDLHHNQTTKMATKCIQCRTETTYKCLTCKASVCNNLENCSVIAPETVHGWKAGPSVAYCVQCNRRRPLSKSSNIHYKQTPPSNSTCDSSLAKRSFTPSHEKKITARLTATKGRSCLDLSQRIELIAFQKTNPGCL